MSRPKNISRRGFLGASAAAGVGLVAISSLSGCNASADSEPMEVSSDTATYVVGSGDIEGTYEEASDTNGTTTLTEAGSWELPLGCAFRPSEGAWKPYVMPNASAAMTSAGAFSISSATNMVFVDSAKSGGNYVVYDAQCSDSVFAWVELDLVTRDWMLYAASISDQTLGSAVTLWQGDADYDPPLMCCSADKVIWLVMPSSSGSKTTESSGCYLWQLGDTNADEVVRSNGRFACAPAISDSNVILTPRVRTNEGRYYGITAYTLESGLTEQVNQLVLPLGVAPMHANYIGDNFVFSIEANYSSGGLLGNMGTYIGSGDGQFIALPREPSAQVAGKDGIYLIKTRASHLIVDTKAQTYATLAAPNRALDYGDYPASMGTTSTFVAFSTVKDSDTGYPGSVTVRAWAL